MSPLLVTTKQSNNGTLCKLVHLIVQHYNIPLKHSDLSEEEIARQLGCPQVVGNLPFSITQWFQNIMAFLKKSTVTLLHAQS